MAKIERQAILKPIKLIKMIPMKGIKPIATASEMSNLVGMWAFLVKNDQIKVIVFVTGKADNKYFICQVVSPLTGEPNVAKLMTLDELREWVIIPTQSVADYILDNYYKDHKWNFNVYALWPKE